MSEVRITVEYFTQARAAAGVAEESLTLSAPATLNGLLRELSRRHGPALGQLLLASSGAPSSGVIFAVGSRHVPAGEDPPLRDGEVVAIVPPIAGGLQ